MTIRKLDLGDGGKLTFCRLYYIETGRESDVGLFLERLAGDDEGEFSKVLECLDRVEQCGPPRNEEKSRFLDKKLRVFELKSGRVRIPAFWEDGRLIICANAFFKDSAKTKKKELKRARLLKKQYDEEKKLKQVEFKE